MYLHALPSSKSLCAKIGIYLTHRPVQPGTMSWQVCDTVHRLYCVSRVVHPTDTCMQKSWHIVPI